MRKVVFVIIVLSILLAGCGLGRPSDETCLSARIQMTDSEWERLDSMQVNLILNNNWPPDSVGGILQDCINGGWDNY